MIGSLLASFALASLPLVFLLSDEKPAALDLPSFEKELYLSVTAKWAADDCVDVAVVTNLPEGTVFVVGAQPRARPGTLRPFEPVDRVFTWTRMVPYAVTSRRMDVPSLFCGLVRAQPQGEKLDTNGLMLEAYVDHTAHFFWKLALEKQIEKQARRIGRHGAFLRGPLVRLQVVDGENRKYAESKTFILEPLPMRAEDEETEHNDETGVDSE